VETEWAERLSQVAPSVLHYQTYPATARTDFLVWSAVRADDAQAPLAFFEAYAAAVRPFRRYARVTDVLWGFTRLSEYSRGRSRQAIDPFQPREIPYLVVYPFTKTAEWYLTPPDARQEMMNEHMSIGKQYREVTQLLLYSAGVQDHDFVVVYETDDLARFSSLVSDLRHTEARRFTASDVPVHVGIRRHASEGPLWP
jgi:chlorite dismutase